VGQGDREIRRAEKAWFHLLTKGKGKEWRERIRKMESSDSGGRTYLETEKDTVKLEEGRRQQKKSKTCW